MIEELKANVYSPAIPRPVAGTVESELPPLEEISKSLSVYGWSFREDEGVARRESGPNMFFDRKIRKAPPRSPRLEQKTHIRRHARSASLPPPSPPLRPSPPAERPPPPYCRQTPPHLP